MPRNDDERPRQLPPGIIRSRDLSPDPKLPSLRKGGGTGEVPSELPLSRLRERGQGGEGNFERGSEGLPPAQRAGGARAGAITAIEPQQKHAGRVSVYIDGKFALGLFEDVAAALSLKVGRTVTPELLEEAAQAETLRRALEDAYRLLSYRDRAEKELSDRLARKGYEAQVVDTVMERLRAAGYLNDTTFAEQWIAGRGAARGRRALAEELRQKGVDRATVDEALAAVRGEETEAESARNAAVRRVGARPADTSREARLRLAAFLQRRGFSWDVVRPVLTELFGIRDGEEGGADDTEIGPDSS